MPNIRSPRLVPVLLASVLALSVSLAARAGTRGFDPPVLNGSCPSLITLVGHHQGVPDPAGMFPVLVLDLAYKPMPGADVVCDFSNCPDLRIAATQPYPGLTVDCRTRDVHALTDATGTARFCIVGGATNTRHSPGAGASTMRVFVDGVLFGSVTAAAVDQGGLDGLSASDLGLWLSDYSAGLEVGRSDYDGSGALGAGDLSRWLTCSGAGGSSSGAGSLPGGVCP